jgi:hypothetical protein
MPPPDTFTLDLVKMQRKTRQGDGCPAIRAAMSAAR